MTMTAADKRLRRAWHLAILAVVEGREVSPQMRLWAQDARRWLSGLTRTTVRAPRPRKQRAPKVVHRPPARLAGLRKRALREQIARDVRDLLDRRAA